MGQRSNRMEIRCYKWDLERIWDYNYKWTKYLCDILKEVQVHATMVEGHLEQVMMLESLLGGVNWACVCHVSSVGGGGIARDVWTGATSGVGSSGQTSRTSSMLEEQKIVFSRKVIEQISLQRETFVALLDTRLTKNNILQRFCRWFISTLSEIMKKTCILKDS